MCRATEFRKRINSNDHPGLAECIGNPRALAALEAMGFGGSRFRNAVIISKPGPSPRLYWAPSIHSAMIDCTLSRASW